MSLKKGIHRFSNAEIIELHLKPLTGPISYPLLLIYEVNDRYHIFPREGKLFKELHQLIF